MVDSSVYSTKTDVELADAARRFGPKYTSQYGHLMMPSHLHRSNAQLGYHPHVHMLVTGGGITPNGEHWEPARGELLVPVGVLSRKIAAKFRDALKRQKPELFASIPAAVWRREWVSFLKHYGHGKAV